MIDTPIGPMEAVSDGSFLLSLQFHASLPVEPDTTVDWVLTLLQAELRAYFDGTLKQFSVPLKPAGTDFEKSVWDALLQIPYGETRTYLQQSIALGNPLSIRAVGRANGKNPIAILIPCHRVIGSDGSLTGYAGGMERKRALLQLERNFQPPVGKLF